MNDEMKKNNKASKSGETSPVFTGKTLAEVASFASSVRTAAIIRAAKMVNKAGTFSKTALGRTVKSFTDVGAGLEIAKLGAGFVTSLAQKIDEWFFDNSAEAPVVEPAEDPIEEIEEEIVEEVVEVTEEAVEEAEPEVAEEIVEEPVAEVVEEIVEEPVEEIVEAVEEAPVEEPVAEEPAVEAIAEVDGGDEDEEEEEEDNLPAGLSSMKLDYIDVMEKPEEYQEMLAREANGEVTLVTRYRRSFMSRLIQSQGNVQNYYNEIKNLLLSYKGVKGRVSWGNESFNKGRTYLAKVNAKTKTLYIYLAIDPATLEEGKYEIVDVSSKKKYAAVPTLIKVKGERKFKYAMELITKLCEADMALPLAKNFEAQDYHTPYAETEDLVVTGLVKKLVAEIPAAPAPAVEE